MSVRLFVGNLPYDATEAELRELFAPVGTLSYVTFPIDRETGRPRGFAFVDFGDRAQADEAIRRFNGKPFKGRALAINEARARENRPAGASPGPRAFSPTSRPFGPRPSTPGSFPRRADQPAMGSMPEEMSRRRNRSFGPDAKPKRGRREDRWAKAEGAKKGPIPIRGGGRLYGMDDDPNEEAHDDTGEEDLLLQEEVEGEDQGY